MNTDRRIRESHTVSTIGELSDIGAADLIEIFAKRGRTGRLTIKASGHEIHFYFDNGRLALVNSTDITLRLGRMLIRQGLLNTPRLLEALHAQAESRPKQPLGGILIERGWITQPDLTRCIEEQLIDALAHVAADRPGVFVFDAGMTPPADVEPVLLDPELLLRAAQERTEALQILHKHLPSEHTPLFLNGSTEDLRTIDHHLEPSESMVLSVLRPSAKS